MNFREMVDAARTRGVPKDRRPRPMRWVAARCGISVPHVYNLIHGRKTPPPWTVRRIARGLRFTIFEVEEALARSRLEAEFNG